MSREVGAARCGEGRAAPAQIRPWKKANKSGSPADVVLMWRSPNGSQLAILSRFRDRDGSGLLTQRKSEGGCLDFFHTLARLVHPEEDHETSNRWNKKTQEPNRQDTASSSPAHSSQSSRPRGECVLPGPDPRRPRPNVRNSRGATRRSSPSPRGPSRRRARARTRLRGPLPPRHPAIISPRRHEREHLVHHPPRRSGFVADQVARAFE